jgi:hypothetical protein
MRHFLTSASVSPANTRGDRPLGRPVKDLVLKNLCVRPIIKPMAAALSFQPIFLYIALGMSGLIAVARLLLGWAMSI